MATQTRKARKGTKTREERDAERTTLRERLEKWLADGFDETEVTYIGMLAHYSERNAQLIAMQHPGATEVHGYVTWKQLGRQVRKGEHGIRILAPAGRQEATEPTEDNPEGAEGRQFFKLTSVFDISQTEPIGESTPVTDDTTESTPAMAGV